MAGFQKNSAWNWDVVTPEHVIAHAPPAQEVARELPLEHWNHDLETVDILLDQRPPDIERARQLLMDVRRELYRELR